MIRDYVALDLEDYRNLQPSVKSEGEAVAADCGTDRNYR